MDAALARALARQQALLHERTATALTGSVQRLGLAGLTPTELERTTGEWRTKPEAIGHPDCPVLLRWRLERTATGRDWLLHHFLPGEPEPDMHDHPWGFATLVLAGEYTDINPEREETLRPGDIAFREARHRHRTRVGPEGAWTLVLTGSASRRWGFWRDGEWIWHGRYAELYGYGYGCGELAD